MAASAGQLRQSMADCVARLPAGRYGLQWQFWSLGKFSESAGRQEIALRRGRQYLREGMNFDRPQMMGGQIHSVVPWSRILDQQEVVAAINTDYNNARTAWVTVDSGLHNLNRPFVCLYSTDGSQIGSEVKTAARNGKAVQLTVPAAGCSIWKAV